MAEANSTFVPKALPLRENHEVTIGVGLWRTYAIGTDQGDLVVEEQRFQRAIRGSAAALEAYGLIKQEWLPGTPGNNKARQTVAFAPSGPWLVYGNRKSSKLDLPHITIVRLSSKTFVVEQLYTKDEHEAMDAFYDEQCKQEHQARRERREAEWKESIRAKTEAEWRGNQLRSLDTFRIGFTPEFTAHINDRFQFNDSSRLRIMARIEELRLAILHGVVVSTKPQQQRKTEGNVIYLETAAH